MGGECEGGWRVRGWVESVRVGGEYEGGWRVRGWVESVRGGALGQACNCSH